MTVPQTKSSYPLTPLQEGMLLHSIVAPGSGVDVEQLLCDFDDGPPADALHQAWLATLDHYPILRTAFRWEQVNQPVQVIMPAVRFSWRELDWQSHSGSAQRIALETFLANDRRQGFDLAEAPLTRVTLIRLGATRWTMVWTFHHILLDGRSFPMILEEVFEAAQAITSGRTPAFRKRPAFERYVDWARGSSSATTEAWWRATLGGYQGSIRMPGVQRERRDEPATTAEEFRTVAPDTTARLNDLAQRLGGTMATMVQTAWAIVVCRYTGTADLVFGVTLATRRGSVPGAEAMAGLLINTVPFRVEINPARSVADTIRDVRHRWSELREHRQTPLRLAQAWGGTPAGQPLFDTLLVYEHDLLAARMKALGGPWTDRRISLREQTNYPVTAAVYGGASLTIKLEYDPGRFDPAQAGRMAGHFHQVLRAIADQPEGLIGDIVMQPVEEEKELVDGWRGRRTEYGREATVPGRFMRVAAERPDAVAVDWDGGCLTYGELDRRSNQFARSLMARGAGPGRLVGVCLDRSPDLMITILGILKTGAGYVPLDPTYPAERLNVMLEDAAPPVVVTQSRHVSRLPIDERDRLLIVDDGSRRGTETDDPLPAVGGPEAPAYVMFTSGSTGRPKGVVVPHRAILRLVVGTDYIDFGPEQVFLGLAPVSFDASTLELWGPLLHGGRLVLFTAPHPSAEALGETIRRHGVTTVWLTAALFQQVVDTDLEALRPVRQLLAGGDVLPVPHVRRVIEGLPATRLVNGYGPTENTTFTCCHRITPADLAGPSIPIGRPIANTTVAIVDDRNRPVPVGVEGELLAGGDGLALGYLNRPELTAERFGTDPLDPTARVYRTGDRARWRPDGTIEFLGRRDLQVKVRGYRIELGEVESVLATHPEVREAVVLSREDVPGTKRLVGYVTGRRSAPSADGLRLFLQARMPDYMVPSAFVMLESFPINANGKIDRRALPAPTAGSADRSFATPTSDPERRLAAIWQDILRLEAVGVDDSFFELGGDSILAIQVAARARQAGVPISAAQIMAHPTIRELAGLADSRRSETKEPARDGPGPVPLTPIQSWYVEQDLADWHHWNQAFLFECDRPLDAERLGRALTAVTSHHDVFRLRFGLVDGTWTQTLTAEPSPVRLEVVDLSSHRADLTNAIEQVTARAAASLDPASGRLMAAVLIHTGPGCLDRLSVTLHHLIVDGVSWRVLREDLESSYLQISETGKATLPPVTTSFAGWARTIATVGSSAGDTERSWWRAQMEADGQIPLDGPRDGNRTEGQADVLIVALDSSETTTLLQQVPAAFNTQINDVLLGALAVGIGPWIGRDEIRIDLEGHGREPIAESRDPSRVVGWFTSVFPFVLRTAPASDPTERLKEVKERLRQTPRRGVGYGLLRYLDRSADVGGAEADFVFNYLGQFDHVVSGSALFRFAAESAGPWHAATAKRRHLIEVIGIVIEGRLELRWTYSPAIHRRETVASLADAVAASLRDLIARCTAPGAGGRTPSDYPLVQLTQPEVDRLAGRGRQTEDILPLAPMQSLFLATAGGHNDIGWSRWAYRLTGDVDPRAFAEAWQAAVSRHQVLRAGFVADGLEEPVQVIHRTVTLDIEVLDWRDLTADEQARRRTARPITPPDADPSRPPLIRVALIRLGERDWESHWSHHHLLLDRWSWPLVLTDVAAGYEAFRQGQSPDRAPASPWRRYLAWLTDQDRAAADRYWAGVLAGLDNAGRVGRLPGASGPDGSARISFSGTERETLLRAAREQAVTVNSVIATAWLLWLGQETGRPDVACGTTVAGRPDEVPGIGTMVGMCINNLPLRIVTSDAEAVGDLIRRVQGSQASAAPFQFVSPVRLQELSGLGWGRRPFETLLVFQHAGADESADRWLGPSVTIRPLPVDTTTNFPITLVVAGDTELTLTLSFQGRFLDGGAAREILNRVRIIIERVAENPQRRVADVVADLGGALLAAGDDNADRPFEPPGTATEWVVAHLWAELFGRARVGRSDNFFDLGGQSLAATQMAARVRQSLKVEIPVGLVFEQPTVAGFAAAVTTRRPAGQVERIAAIVRQVEEMTEQDLREAVPGV